MKRAFDLTIVLLLAPFWVTVLALTALGVYLKLGRPIIFSQIRPGRAQKLFKMYKFRSMTDARDDQGALLSDEKRLTSFGRLLRASSLDELPELVNVLRGEMSLVGPRPLLCEYLPLYSERQARRHDVLPGVTGWAQINGRNAISWEEKFEHDVWYVENQNLMLDLKILALTFLHLIRPRGIHPVDAQVMPRFTGSHK